MNEWRLMNVWMFFFYSWHVCLSHIVFSATWSRFYYILRVHNGLDLNFILYSIVDSGLRVMNIPTGLARIFLEIASPNTRQNRETCGILTGKLVSCDHNDIIWNMKHLSKYCWLIYYRKLSIVSWGNCKIHFIHNNDCRPGQYN